MTSSDCVLLSDPIQGKSRCLFLYLWFNQKHMCPRIEAYPVSPLLGLTCASRMKSKHLRFTKPSSHRKFYWEEAWKSKTKWTMVSKPCIFHFHILRSRRWPALGTQLYPESLFPYALFRSTWLPLTRPISHLRGLSLPHRPISDWVPTLHSHGFQFLASVIGIIILCYNFLASIFTRLCVP